MNQTNELKECLICRNIYPKTSEYFNKHNVSDDGLQYYCRICNMYSYIKYQYGLTRERYIEMYELQKGCCMICGIHKELYTFKNRGRQSVLYVDHCHETGRVRGLLCLECNKGLGAFKDSLDLLQRAILYLHDQLEYNKEDIERLNKELGKKYKDLTKLI